MSSTFPGLNIDKHKPAHVVGPEGSGEVVPAPWARGALNIDKHRSVEAAGGALPGEEGRALPEVFDLDERAPGPLHEALGAVPALLGKFAPGCALHQPRLPDLLPTQKGPEGPQGVGRYHAALRVGTARTGPDGRGEEGFCIEIGHT